MNKLNTSKSLNIAATMIFFGLSGCATPDVVETKKLSDHQLGCQELAQEISKCEENHKEIQKEKGVTGKNVAATVFFWPALIVTHSNVSNALQALNERKNHLISIYHEKKCKADCSAPSAIEAKKEGTGEDKNKV